MLLTITLKVKVSPLIVPSLIGISPFGVLAVPESWSPLILKLYTSGYSSPWSVLSKPVHFPFKFAMVAKPAKKQHSNSAVARNFFFIGIDCFLHYFNAQK